MYKLRKIRENIMKQVRKIESSICCKATASLDMEIASELQKKDKSLGNLLNDKEKEDRDTDICGCGNDKDEGCGNSI